MDPEHHLLKTDGWKKLTVVEIKTYLGLSFLTGVIKKPEQIYWATDILSKQWVINDIVCVCVQL